MNREAGLVRPKISTSNSSNNHIDSFLKIFKVTVLLFIEKD